MTREPAIVVALHLSKSEKNPQNIHHFSPFSILEFHQWSLSTTQLVSAHNWTARNFCYCQLRHPYLESTAQLAVPNLGNGDLYFSILAAYVALLYSLSQSRIDQCVCRRFHHAACCWSDFMICSLLFSTVLRRTQLRIDSRRLPKLLELGEHQVRDEQQGRGLLLYLHVPDPFCVCWYRASLVCTLYSLIFGLMTNFKESNLQFSSYISNIFWMKILSWILHI